MEHRSAWRHVPALLIAVGCLAPFVFVVIGSLREPGPPPRTPQWPSWPLAFDNYRTAFDLVGMSGKIVNSLLVAAVTVPIGVLVASTAGFGIARLPRRPRRQWSPSPSGRPWSRRPRSFLGLFVYRSGFQYLRFGYAAAATVVMLALTGVLIAVQYAILRRWRHARIA